MSEKRLKKWNIINKMKKKVKASMYQPIWPIGVLTPAKDIPVYPIHVKKHKKDTCKKNLLLQEKFFRKYIPHVYFYTRSQLVHFGDWYNGLCTQKMSQKSTSLLLCLKYIFVYVMHFKSY